MTYFVFALKKGADRTTRVDETFMQQEDAIWVCSQLVASGAFRWFDIFQEREGQVPLRVYCSPNSPHHPNQQGAYVSEHSHSGQTKVEADLTVTQAEEKAAEEGHSVDVTTSQVIDEHPQSDSAQSEEKAASEDQS